MNKFLFLSGIMLAIYPVIVTSSGYTHDLTLGCPATQPDSLQDFQLLYNGREWKNLYQQVENDQFFLSGAFLTGSLTMQGKTFHRISMKYDVFKDEILIPLEGGAILQVNKEMVDSFSVFFHNRAYRFARLSGDSIAGLNGYARVIYNGKTALYVKYIKRIDRPGVENQRDRFYQVTRIFLVKDGLAWPVAGKGDLLRILKDKRSQIRDYMNAHHIRVSNHEPESYMPVLHYYDSLHP